MNDLQQELDRIFMLISSVPVKGDSVELIAEARKRLRRLYQTISEEEEGEDKNGG